MIDCIKKSQCTGCKMCADVCNRHAISFITDKDGFWYPRVDKEKCNNCGLCANKCPAINQEKVKATMEPVVYAAWSRDGNVRHESTSGGFFFEIAKIFIDKGGVVAGARYGKDWKSAEHFLARDMNELEGLRGSKYFQSDTAGIYKEVKKEADDGKEVLFCGTPCQNAALAMYLGKEYSNVYYLDFICRSINSPLAFERYITELEEIYGAEVVKVQLKNKKKGWQSLGSQVCFANGEESLLDREHDWWIKGFICNDLYTRESCFHCQYRTIPRKVADITIGDFWGIVGESSYDMFEGISVVLINTPKGHNIFEQVKPFLYIKRKSMEQVLSGNRALLESPIRTCKRDKFFDLIQEHSFSKSVMICTNASEKKDNCIRRFLNVVKDLQRARSKGEISILKYLYLNYFCKNVVHNGNAKIIPYKNVVFDVHPTARINLYGDRDLEIGINKLKGSKAETHIRMDRDSVWNSYHGGYVYFNTTIEIKDNAVFDAGFFIANGGSVIVVEKKVTFGEDVMLGRNVMVYDSDFHQLLNEEGETINVPQEVTIGNHVWLTSNINVLKGVAIGENTLVAAQTVVNKSLPNHSMIAGMSNGKCVKDFVRWSDTRVPKYEDILKQSKIILFGYGVVGKSFYAMHRENVEYIVDNFAKDSKIYTFKEFGEKYPKLGNEYVWVIASPNYFSELYWQVKKKYPNMLIIEAK